MTLSEVVVAMGVAGIVLLSLGGLYLYSTRSFVTLKNHLDLDSASSRAMDRIGKEIRQADCLLAFATNSMTFLRGESKFRYVYVPSERALKREDTKGTVTLMEDCDSMRFEMFQRKPLTGGQGFYPATSADECKVVQVSWFATKQTGKSSPNASSLRSAQIVIRNQKAL